MSKPELLTQERLAMIAKCSTNNGHVRMLLGHIQALTEQRDELMAAFEDAAQDAENGWQARPNTVKYWHTLLPPAPQEEGKPNE